MCQSLRVGRSNRGRKGRTGRRADFPPLLVDSRVRQELDRVGRRFSMMRRRRKQGGGSESEVKEVEVAAEDGKALDERAERLEEGS